MKKFKFTLESILGLKENMEENEKMLLYRMKAELNALYLELEELNNIYMRYVNERKASSKIGITIAKLKEITQYIDEVDKKKALKQDEIEQMQVTIDNQTEVLKQVRIEVKTLERLKENQLTAHNEMVSKENELLIEDFIAGRI